MNFYVFFSWCCRENQKIRLLPHKYYGINLTIFRQWIIRGGNERITNKLKSEIFLRINIYCFSLVLHHFSWEQRGEYTFSPTPKLRRSIGKIREQRRKFAQLHRSKTNFHFLSSDSVNVKLDVYFKYININFHFCLLI